MISRRVYITNRFGEKLVGIESSPSSRNSLYPAVLLVHGFADSKSESGKFDVLAARLNEDGFIVYLFDFSGCGESEGEYTETTLTKLVDDLEAIWRFVNSQPRVDRKRVGILGQSFGTTTILASGIRPAATVFVGSIIHPKECLSRLFGCGYNPYGSSVRKRSNGTTTRINPQFWKDLNHHNVVDAAKKLGGFKLFIHGANDDHIPQSETLELFHIALSPKTLKIIEMDHGWEPQRILVCEVATEFFVKNLR